MSKTAEKANARRAEQVSIVLDPQLRAELERAAAREHRTMSGQARHILAKVFEAQREGVAA